MLIEPLLDKPIGMNNEPTSKVHYDFIDVAARAYTFAWDRRKPLFYLALLPIGIKFLSLLIILFFDLQDHYLRQGLILMPSYFAEGWLAAQTIRLMLMTDDRMLGASGPQARFAKSSFEQNRRNLLATVLLYALMMLIYSVFTGSLVTAGLSIDPEAVQPEPNALLSLMSIFMIFFILWAFRFFWLYVAIGLGYRVKEFVKKLKPFYISFYMLGTWLICLVPIFLAMMLASDLLLSVSGEAEVKHGAGHFAAVYFLRALFEAILAILTTTAMAYAITAMIEGTSSK